MQKSPRLLAVLIIPAALAASYVLTGCRSFVFRAEIEEERTVDLAEIEEVHVESTNGELVFLGEDRDDLHVQITRTARGSSEDDAREHAEAVEVEFSRDSEEGTLRLVTRAPRHLRHRSAGASMVLRIPRRLDVCAKTSNGRIEASDIEGNLEARSSNGKIGATRIVGDLSLRTSNGAIFLDEIDARSITAATSNGSIRASDCRGDTHAETTNGSVDLELVGLSANPRVLAKTSNGSVKLNLPTSVAADLRLSTSNGSIEADLDGAEITRFSKSRRDIEATLNGGGGEVEARTTNGKVRVRTNR